MKEIPQNPSVIVLGGAGEMGRKAVSIISDFENIGELVVADFDLASAEKIVAKNASEAKRPLKAVSVDVTDSEQLISLLEGNDIVLNMTGPFYRLGVPVLEAAIAAGCHYLDICDDWEPTIDMLALHEKAVESDVIAVIGIGASPGISNILARVVCDRLDRVDDLYTVWPVDAGDERGDAIQVVIEENQGASAAIVHWMQQISGEIEVVKEGHRVTQRPMLPVTLNYPNAGEGTGYTVGHPEPITLVKTMGIQGSSASLMLLRKHTAAFIDGLRKQIDAGQLSLEAGAKEIGKPSLLGRLKAAFRSFWFPGPGDLPLFFAWARGEHNGESRVVGATFTSAPADGMAGITSWPLAIALSQLLDGRITTVGVHPPETVIEPEHFFNMLAQACEPPVDGMEELVIQDVNSI
ncbi:saccharopine dehydrogenase NADP-binding domain-containing protein [Acidimicrobiaceae bacterium]|nr:saccharopine dehydrogenase NADP-binding domain-containing protein [Acidimicrobiaceae bacterium]